MRISFNLREEAKRNQKFRKKKIITDLIFLENLENGNSNTRIFENNFPKGEYIRD